MLYRGSGRGGGGGGGAYLHMARGCFSWSQNMGGVQEKQLRYVEAFCSLIGAT